MSALALLPGIDGELKAVGVQCLPAAHSMVAAPGAMLAGGALIWVSFAIFTARMWPVLWQRAAAPRGVISPRVR